MRFAVDYLSYGIEVVTRGIGIWGLDRVAGGETEVGHLNGDLVFDRYSRGKRSLSGVARSICLLCICES